MTSPTHPDHTFVVLAYKESHFLDQCISSLKAKTKPCTIVVSTSTPSPFLDDLCTKHSLPLYINPISNGIASDWSFALQQSTTRYTTLAHQDDLYSPNYTELMVARASERMDNLITFSDYHELFGDTTKVASLNLMVKRLLRTGAFLHERHISSRLRKSLLLAFGSPIPCPSVMYNSHALKDFTFSREFSINMDWDAWLRIARMTGSISCVTKPLVIHRIHEESETSAGLQDQRRSLEDRAIFERIWPSFLARQIAWLYKLGYLGNTAPRTDRNEQRKV